MTRQPDRRYVYLAGAAIGLLVNLLVFGPGHLLGSSSYWDYLEPDSQSNLMGYRYFLHEPWHWPFFDTRTMNVPFVKNIAITDRIEPFAALNKALADVLPRWGPFSRAELLGRSILRPRCAACRSMACRALGRRVMPRILRLHGLLDGEGRPP